MEPIKIIDIKDMPNYNPTVKNGVDSVSSGKVFVKTDPPYSYPCCETHGAMLKVSKDGIWRCGEINCSNGAYQLKVQ